MANELRPYKAENTPTVGSIFNDFEEFQKALQIASALSKTTLIPQNFQGKPEDCVVAIDYSRRLGLPPTAVMPHLFVINGRPSLSAQFTIALLNRSGKFSRIQWLERAEGTVEYTFNREKRVVPNYSAVAYFTELASGKKYESPVVDVKLALTSGWLIKRDKFKNETESLWAKIPQLMCRYRSAATLIKTVCPELALGMDIDDGSGGDAEPFTAEEPEPQPARRVEAVVRTAAVDVKNDEERFAELKEAIAASGLAALRLLGRQIADSGLPEHYLNELREDYRKRRAELAAENAASSPAKIEPQPAPAAAETATQADVDTNAPSAAPDQPVNPDELSARIAAANDYGELTSAWSAAEGAFALGTLPTAQYDAFLGVFDQRLGELRQKFDAQERALFTDFIKEVNAAEGDKDQKNWAQELARTISTQTEPELITRNNLQTADEWLASGALTESLHAAVGKYARARLNAFFGAADN